MTIKNLREKLLADHRINDCAILTKTTQNTQKKLIAYIVTSDPINFENLKLGLSEHLAPPFIPDDFIKVTNIPLDENGNVNQKALEQIEVADKTLITKWETELKSLATIKEVAVIPKAAPSPPPYHITKLFNGFMGKPQQNSNGSKNSDHKSNEGAYNFNPNTEKPMAISDGGPLNIPDGEPKTMVEALLRTVKRYPTKGITYIQNDDSHIFQNYAALLEEAKCILAGLYKQGLKPKDRVIFQVATLENHFSAFWACVLGGIIPVTVAIAPEYETENSVVNKLFNIWKLLESPPIITNDSLQESIQGLANFLPMPTLKTLTVESLKDNPPTDSFFECQPEHVLFHQLTSGSTGVPKCIQITHKGVIAHIHGGVAFNGYHTDDINLNWLPMDHVVPILTCHLKDVYLGCSQIEIKPTQILSNPLKWLDYIAEFKVTHSWSPNFGFKLINDSLKAGGSGTWDLSSVKYLLNAGEQVTYPVVKDFVTLLKPYGLSEHAMQPSFGMAEACTCMTFRNEFEVNNNAHVHKILKSSLGGDLEKATNEVDDYTTFIDLGPPVPGIQIRIADKENKPVPEGVIGRFQIKGDVITPGYLNNPSANAEAFVGDDWFNSGDLGFIWDGCLTLTGREKEMIVIRGANYYCYEIEDVVNGLEGVESTFVGACGVDDPNTGSEGLVIFFVPSNTLSNKAHLITTIKQKVATNIGISPLYIIPLSKETFPKTTSGKIQRGRLKKSFLEGDYNHLCEDVDILLGNQNTLPQWFFKPTWHRDEATQANDIAVKTVLLLLDESGLALNVAKTLKEQNHPCILLEKGETFEKVGDSHYKINPLNASDYQQVIKTIANKNTAISHILHFWTYEDEVEDTVTLKSLTDAQQKGVFSALHLVQSLVTSWSANNKFHLYFFSAQSQKVLRDEPISCENAPLIGLIRTITQEHPWLQTRHIDLQKQPIAVNSTHILREISIDSISPEVAYRNETRWRTGLESINLSQHPKADFPLKQEGLYIITGGLGGIGLELSKYLIKQFNARLIILGRHALSSTEQNVSSPQKQAYQALADLKGTFIYKSVDISNEESLQHAINEAVAHYNCPPDGIFHLAGAYHDKYLADETLDSFHHILRAKVEGTYNLAQVLQKYNPKGLFVSFSSIFSYFGASNVGAYAAANRFLNAYTLYLRQKSNLKSVCYGWSNWNDIGMSKGYQSLQAKGYEAISIKQGMLSLMAALQHNIPFMLIGLNGNKANVSVHCNVAPQPLEHLVAYFSSAQNHPPLDTLENIKVLDDFGIPSQCTFEKRASLPLLPSGEVNKDKLKEDIEAKNKQANKPQTQVEHTITAIWKEVLDIEQVGVEDSFFEVGGSSVLMAQLQHKIEQSFDKKFSSIEMFKYPTIRLLSNYLENVEPESSTNFKAKSDKRAKARKRINRRKR